MNVLFVDSRNGFEASNPHITIGSFINTDILDISNAEEQSYTRHTGGNFRKINEQLGELGGDILYEGKKSNLNIEDYEIDEIYLLKIGNY